MSLVINTQMLVTCLRGVHVVTPKEGLSVYQGTCINYIRFKCFQFLHMFLPRNGNSVRGKLLTPCSAFSLHPAMPLQIRMTIHRERPKETVRGMQGNGDVAIPVLYFGVCTCISTHTH